MNQWQRLVAVASILPLLAAYRSACASCRTLASTALRHRIRGHVYMKASCRIDTGEFGIQFSGKSKFFASILNEDGIYYGVLEWCRGRESCNDELGALQQAGDCGGGNSAALCSEAKARKCDYYCSCRRRRSRLARLQTTNDRNYSRDEARPRPATRQTIRHQPAAPA